MKVPPQAPSPDTFHALYSQVKKKAEGLQPGFDAVLVKAEGKLAPGKGYLGRRGLEGTSLVDRGPEVDDAGVDTDSVDWREWDTVDTVDRPQIGHRGYSSEGLEVDRDELKIDRGNGWNSLHG